MRSKMSRTIVAVSMLLGASPSYADQDGEDEFKALKAMGKSITVRACTIRTAIGPQPSGRNAEPDPADMVVLVENGAPEAISRDGEWHIEQQHAMMFFITAENELISYCGNGLVGLDEQCGTGDFTGHWSRCVLQTMRNEAPALPISRVKRRDLLRMARMNDCGTFDRVWTPAGEGVYGHWSGCTVTPSDGRKPYTFDQE